MEDTMIEDCVEEAVFTPVRRVMFEPYLPTPEQIAAACKTIQAEWSAMEKIRRRAGEIRELDFESDC